MKLKSGVLFLRDLVISAVIIGIILLTLFIYTGNWPPLVVIESDSMQHGNDSAVGVIDTGDLVMVKKVRSTREVTTWVEGRNNGYKAYGQYGDVIIYKKNGGTETPVIHRAVMYLEFNESAGNSFDIPALRDLTYGKEGNWYVRSQVGSEILPHPRWLDLNGQYNIYLSNYGFGNVTIKIDIGAIMNQYSRTGLDPHSGFVTVGDHNAARDNTSAVDQGMLDAHDGKVRPIKLEWIIGKAKGELPWMGIVKLKFSENSNSIPKTSVYMFFVVLAMVLTVPIVLSFIYNLIKKAVKKGKEEKEGTDTEDGEIRGEVLVWDDGEGPDRREFYDELSEDNDGTERVSPGELVEGAEPGKRARKMEEDLDFLD